MFSSFSEVTEFLYNQLPYFQKQGQSAYKPGLKNIENLCELRGNPQNTYKTIHIAGTNGKGSSSHMVASILQESGYKVGLYTSPHLKSFTERIKINGKEVSKKWIINYVNTHLEKIHEIKPSFFEWAVVMAFDYFKENKVDYAVIEVGLGGRLDSTNIIQPEICLITNIGFDHVEILGDSLDKIAYEKAGIIKNEIPVCISEYNSETKPVFIAKAKQENAPIEFASDNFEIIQTKAAKKYQKIHIRKNETKKEFKIKLGLLGNYQAYNCRGVLALIEKFEKTQGIKIKKKDLLNGFKNVLLNTNFKGRWQELNHKPMIIADTAHNIDGIKILAKQIKFYPAKNKYILFGISRDKLKKEIIEQLEELESNIILIGGKNERLVPFGELQDFFNQITNKSYIGYPNVNLALKKVKKLANKKDLIIICGSNFIIAEINQL